VTTLKMATKVPRGTPVPSKVEKTKVKRYWPGKKPRFIDGEYSSDEEENNREKIKLEENSQRTERKIPVKLGAEAEASRNRRRNVAVIVQVNPENVASEFDIKAEDADLEMPQIKEGETETEEDVEVRRARVRERLKKRRQEQNEDEMADTIETVEIKKEITDEHMPDVTSEGAAEPDEEEDSSEYTTDSEDESGVHQMLKPVFVPKSERETIAEREKLEEAEEALKKEEQRLREERKKDTKRLVAEEIKKEENVIKSDGNKSDNENDGADSDGNAEEEYIAWKVREMKRIKREKEERETAEKERLEIERRRNMTEEERKREDELLGKANEDKRKDRKKLKFLQKYYHKGAFYQDVESDKRDQVAIAAVGEDQFDKAVLPKVMQVKNFGRSGRTKYTHLVDQDTTGRENPWFMADTLKKKAQQQTFTGDSLDKPSYKRKR